MVLALGVMDWQIGSPMLDARNELTAGGKAGITTGPWKQGVAVAKILGHCKGCDGCLLPDPMWVAVRLPTP